MTDDAPAPLKRKMFVKASSVPKLSPDSLKRQGLISHLAYTLFENPREAIQFLNQSNASLGGRPLDVATMSANGYAAVEQAIRLLTAPHAGKKQ